MFLSPWFALAGVILAAGPVVIHLLNRQRHRVIAWAAMDFLRHAIRRSRRWMRLHDLLLLALRTVCVLLFGLAMARPFLTRASGLSDPDQPIHAVLVVDNSLSMSYEQLGGTVLDAAKARAREFIDRLPPGSQVSILPACGSAQEFNLGAYSTKEDALEALAAIEPVDRSAAAAAAIDLAGEACRRVPNPPAKQVVFLSDQQEANWPAESLQSQLEALGAPVQIVQAAARDAENAWIADFRLQAGIADLATPAVFLATVRFDGAAPRQDVQVSLSVEGSEFATVSVDLEPGQAREVRFPPYQFDVPVPRGGAAFAAAEVSLPRDRLPADDRRFLAVPVVSALPVVFVDQLGSDEDPQRNRFGETFRLRRLLAPVTSRSQRDPQLVEVRHVKLDGLDEEVLNDARLVVVAGVAAPQPASAIQLLRQYVEQGGSLVLAAGGGFDPAAWTAGAWNDGMGILPAPLKPTPVGGLPGSAGAEPFQLDVRSLVHEYFLVEQTPREEADELYRLPYFFKAVEADVEPLTITNLAERTRPHVLGSFTNQVPFLVERNIGRGRVLFVSTGVFRQWSTLTSVNTVVLFDRIFRDLLERTLPKRNLTTTERIEVPVAAELRETRFTLTDPAGRQEWVSADALGGDRYGIVVRNLPQRGFYRIAAAGPQPAAAPAAAQPPDVLLAVNGPAQESELKTLDEAGLRERMEGAQYRWIAGEESIRLLSAQLAGEELWKWLLAAVLGCLVLEMAILGWPLAGRERAG